MDYLDSKKQLRDKIILYVGYACVAIAVAIASFLLVELTYGYNIGKNGTVIQNGLTYFSSHPNPAKIYINDQLRSVETNTRLALPEGIYKVKLTREGYNDWQRIVEVDGGDIVRFDYPFLVPKQLNSVKLGSYQAAPGMVSQSPDQRWLMVQKPSDPTSFDIYDLKNLSRPAKLIDLPTELSNILKDGTLKPISWADDNRHLLIKHVSVTGKISYLLIDRSNPSKSISLNQVLASVPSTVTLIDKKFDKYYLYDPTKTTLSSASLDSPTPKLLLSHVVDYKSYGDDTLLYAANDGVPAGSVEIRIKQADQVYAIKSLPAPADYLLDLTKYSGKMYVVVGSTNGNKTYVYKDPVSQLKANPDQVPVPTQVLHVPKPSHVSFSDNAQFIVAENGQRFGVYDIENQHGYNYTIAHKLDAPQPHANWMDGNRLTIVSGGKLMVFDYDNTNWHPLGKASAKFVPAFTPDFKNVVSLTPAAGKKLSLNHTWLLTKPDR